MTPAQARALLALLADLYQLANQPDHEPKTERVAVSNGQERAVKTP